MNKNLTFTFLFLLVFNSGEAGEIKSYEMPRTKVAPIKDSRADRQYELYIKLPEEYSENIAARYPVIYTTDAIWHMDMLSGATEYLMPNVILVGISWQKDLAAEDEFVSRFRDYTMTKLSDPEIQAKYQPGQASNHLDFVRNDVIPYVENNYRADPGERTYFGYSLGGRFGAYVLLAQPDTFKYYILGSPSFNQRSEKYIGELEERLASRQRGISTDVFVSIGELEKDGMGPTERFVSVLQRRSEAGLTLFGLEIIEGSDHGAAFPETVIRGVKWLSRMESE